MSLNFREREPLKTPTRHFEIPTSNLRPPPPGRSSVLMGRVVRKLINANPGLKVNWGYNFSFIKVLSIAYGLRLLMLKTEGQKIEAELFAEKRNVTNRLIDNAR